MTIRAAIFDLDGTLIDSLGDIADAVNYMMESFGRPGFSRAEVRGFIGKGARNLTRMALNSNDPSEIDVGLARFLEYSKSHIADKSKLYPGAMEMLTTLNSHGVSLAVVSNKDEVLCASILRVLGVDTFFKVICGAGTFEEMKPSPVPLLRTVDLMAARLEDAVMIGDSVNDVQAGISAGMLTIGCSWGYGAPDELQKAHYTFDSCHDLAKFLLNGEC